MRFAHVLKALREGQIGSAHTVDAFRLPSSVAMRDRQMLAAYGRLQFQGSEEGPEVPLWGRMSPLFFDLLWHHIRNPGPINAGTRAEAELTRFVNGAGIPSISMFTHMLDVYVEELTGCSLLEQTLLQGVQPQSSARWIATCGRHNISSAHPTVLQYSAIVRESNARLRAIIDESDRIAEDSPIEGLLKRNELVSALKRERETCECYFGKVYSGPLAPSQGRRVIQFGEDQRTQLWAYWRYRCHKRPVRDLADAIGLKRQRTTTLLADIDRQLARCPGRAYEDELAMPSEPVSTLNLERVLWVAAVHYSKLIAAGYPD